MRKTSSIWLLLAAVLLLGLAGSRHEPLLRFRAEHHLASVAPLENAPPLVAFTTVVLGGFRSLLTDILWLRASYLQDAGKYFELVQLSDWITKLDPRCTEIWAFHAWNMAYNISVMMPEREDRWRWVLSGLKLLRDEGLQYNPGDPDLYFQLGWIFQHKIGGFSDSAHVFYKQKWASEMTALLGGGHPDYPALSSGGAGNILMREYKMDPALMKQLDDQLGPFDWRLPEAHAVYWAWRGKTVAASQRHLPCDRMIQQSMVTMFLHGDWRVRPEDQAILMSPDLNRLPGVLLMFDRLCRDYPGEPTLLTAHENFLKAAVYVLNFKGRRNQAMTLYNRLRELFPGGQETFEDLCVTTPGRALLEAELPAK